MNFKKILINLTISLVITFITFFSLGLIKQDYNLAQDDSLRHNRFAYNINKYGFLENDKNHNWGDMTEYSILDKYNVDIWQGHNLFLSLLLKAGISIEDLNKYYISLFIFLLSFITLSLNSYFKNPTIIGVLVITLLAFVNLEIYFRILLSRPYLFTILFFLLILITLYKKKYYYLFFIFLLASYYHGLFYLLFMPVFLYVIVFRYKIKESIKILSSSFFGSIIGILIHTKSISYFILSFITIFFVPIINKKLGPVSELSIKVGTSLISIGVILILLNIYIFASYKNKFNKNIFFEDKFYLFINLLNFFLIILTSLISRFGDFLFVSSVFTVIYLVYKILEFEKYKINSKINIFGSILLILIIFISQNNYVNSINKNENYYIGEKKLFLNEIKNKMEKGSTIISNGLYNFYDFYYYLSDDYKYIMTMEQVYIYLNDKNIYNDLQDSLLDYAKEPKNKEIDNYKVFKDLGVKYYVLLDEKNNYLLNRSLKYKINQINENPNFILIYNYKNNYLWELK